MNDQDPRLARLQRILRDQGGLYSVEDVFEELKAGRMQSFDDDETSVLTTIKQYPQKRALEVIMAWGTLKGMYKIQPRVVAFAKDNNCDLILAGARVGWEGVKTPGWEAHPSTLYIRRLSSAARE